jgi:hypothetical protein
LADPAGGFYIYSSGDRPLIKFKADNSIAWQLRYEPDVNEIREVTHLDVLSNGDLIAIIGTTSNPHLFGQQYTLGGTYLAQLRAIDGSPVLVKPCDNCALTAVKARPGGGYFCAGYNLGAAKIGSDDLHLTSVGVFFAQYTSALDWILSGNVNSDPNKYSINEIRTVSGASLKIFAGGTAPGPWTFGAKTMAQGGAYLLTANSSGQTVAAQVIGTNAVFAAMETTPNGQIHFAANSGGTNLLERIEADGSFGWSKSIPGAGSIVALTPTDGPFVIGGADFTVVSALDSFGNLKWQRTEATRSKNNGTGIAALNDGRLAFSGDVLGSGMFIDDFFLKDFAQDQLARFGCFVGILETRAVAPPVFRMQPRDQKFAALGETVTLHVDVYSQSPVTFAWFKDGAPIPNQTSADLTIASAQATDSGTYFVEARNSAGATRSTPAQVVINSITVSTIAGSDGVGVFETPLNPIILPDDSVLVADSAKNVIKRVGASGITTFAGNGQAGLANGAPADALFSGPTALAVEWRNFPPLVFVADRGNNRVRRINVSSQTGEAVSVDEVTGVFASVNCVATLDGAPFFMAASADSSALWKSDDNGTIDLTVALANSRSSAIAVDVRGNLYIGDGGLGQIRRRTPVGGIQIVAAATEPTGIAVDDTGNLYVTERASHSILKISPLGLIRVVAGSGAPGAQNGNALQASFNAPEGLCFRGNSLIVADTGNHCLREIKFEPAQIVVTGTAKISATVGSFLRLSVAGNVGEQYAVESAAQVGPAATWQNEGTVSIGQVTSDLLLPKPTATRFYRARKIP